MDLQAEARRIAADIERRTGRKVKSVELTVTRTTTETRKTGVTQEAQTHN